MCNADYPCEGMSRHATFENFGMAFLTLFQVSTGDNWNGIMKVIQFTASSYYTRSLDICHLDREMLLTTLIDSHFSAPSPYLLRYRRHKFSEMKFSLEGDCTYVSRHMYKHLLCELPIPILHQSQPRQKSRRIVIEGLQIRSQEQMIFRQG